MEDGRLSSWLCAKTVCPQMATNRACCKITLLLRLTIFTGKFKEPLFHPNVFPSGAVDLNFLSAPQTYWKSSITIMEVTAVASLLFILV